MEQPDQQQWRDCGADRGPAVEERDRPAALAPREPFRHRLRRPRPVARLAGSEQETKEAEGTEPSGKRRQHRGRGVERHGYRQARARADGIEKATGPSLPDGVGDAEGDDHEGEIRIRPVVLTFEGWTEDAERLAIDVVDDGGEKEQASDPPSQAPGRAAATCGQDLHLSASSAISSTAAR